ncbi:MAG: 5-oxoprolinase subunit PxpB [Lysinibacillus sp.]
MANFDCQPLGDQAVVLTFGQTIDETVHSNIQQALQAIQAANFPWVVDIVPSYTTICVYYDVVQIALMHNQAPYKFVVDSLLALKIGESTERHTSIIEIPVLYGGEDGPDLSYVASYCGLTEEDVILRHTRREYKVHMLGFLPGFPYLSGLDETIAVPRKDVPSALVRAGSVGIAGDQTGIYPLDSPGGWQIIGRTRLPLFDVTKTPPNTIQAGDTIKFIAIRGDIND